MIIGYWSESQGICATADDMTLLPSDAIPVVNDTDERIHVVIDKYVEVKKQRTLECYQVPLIGKTYCY